MKSSINILTFIILSMTLTLAWDNTPGIPDKHPGFWTGSKASGV